MKAFFSRIAKSRFPRDVACGFAIGIAFIIPGFSGGSVAAILGIYERLVEAVADIFKSFKKSVATLFPIGLGLIAGAVSLLFPISYGLEHYPFPTVCLFVGLAIGGMPSITDKLRGKKRPTNVIACAVPLIAALSLSFLPIGADVNLFELDPLGYLILVIVGMVGSAALVVPGISGSMLLLILGYYNPILSVITNHLLVGRDILLSLSVLACTGIGICIGFIGISVIMKLLLKKCPRGTYFAILGFIIGSVPTVYISTAKEAGYTLSTLPTSPLYWAVSVIALAIGFALSFSLVVYARRHAASDEKGSPEKIEP